MVFLGAGFLSAAIFVLPLLYGVEPVASVQADAHSSLFAKPSLLAADEARDRLFVFNSISGTVVGLQASSKEALGRVSVAPGVADMVLNPKSGDLYLPDPARNSVTVIRADTWTKTNSSRGAPEEPERILLGVRPFSLAFDPARGRLYAANFQNNSVSVVDVAEGRVLATVGVGHGPRRVAVNPKTGVAYVANETDRSIAVLGGEDLRVKTIIRLPFAPRFLLVDGRRAMVYAAPLVGNSIVRIPEATLRVQELAVGRDPRDFVLDPRDGTLFIAAFAGNALVKVSPRGFVNATLVLPDGAFPGGIALDISANILYVPFTGTAQVAIVDVGADQMRITKIIKSGTNTDRATLNKTAGEAYFVNPESDTLTVLNIKTHAGSFLPAGQDPKAVVSRAGPVFDFPFTVAVNDSDRLLYVVNNVGQSVAVVDTERAVPPYTTRLGRNPRNARYVQDVGKLYVSVSGENAVAVLDRRGERVLRQIPVGKKPRSLSYHASTKRLFVVNQDSNSMSVIDVTTDEVVATIAVAKAPFLSFTTDSASRLIVAHGADPVISVVDVYALREVGRVALPATFADFVLPQGNSRAFVLLRSPSALAVLDSETAKLEQTISLNGDAMFVVATNDGIVVGQNLVGGFAELAVIDPVSLETKARARLDHSLVPAGAASISRLGNQVVFYDLATRRRLRRFDTTARSVYDVVQLPFGISHLNVQSRMSSQIYVLHDADNAASIVDMQSGQVYTVTNATPFAKLRPGSGGVIFGVALVLLVSMVVAWRRFRRRLQRILTAVTKAASILSRK